MIYNMHARALDQFSEEIGIRSTLQHLHTANTTHNADMGILMAV
jgi:hypothetical protein